MKGSKEVRQEVKTKHKKKIFHKLKIKFHLGMVAYAFNPSHQES